MRKMQSFALITILFLAFIFDVTLVNAENQQKTVATDILNVRSGPGLSYDVIGQLKKSDTVHIKDTYNEWYKIEFDGKEGWIASWLTSSTSIKQTTKASSTEVVSRVNALNFRESPSLDAAVITRLNAGDRATLFSKQGEWANISYQGRTGWVHTQYISEVAGQSNETNVSVKKESQQNGSFKVIVDALNVRKSPDLSSKRTDLIYKNETYPILERNGNWVKIKINDSNNGWVYSFHGETTESHNTASGQSTSGAVTVLSNGTNVRQSPSTSSTVVARVNAGDRLTIQSEENDWYQVQLSNGQVAYIAKWVVSSNDQPSTNTNQKSDHSQRARGTLKGLTIAIDAGHGGNDKGTIGARGTFEKTVTLKTAELLSSKLKAAGANVILTRESDQYVSLNQRVWTSIQRDADAFISLHYDANPDPTVNGFTTYYLHSNQQSLARAVNQNLNASIPLRNRGAQQGNYFVLRENGANAILIELGFLSNPIEESNINTNQYREQATHGIYRGVISHFDAQLN